MSEEATPWTREAFISWLLSRGEHGIAEWVKKNLPSGPTANAGTHRGTDESPVLYERNVP